MVLVIKKINLSTIIGITDRLQELAARTSLTSRGNSLQPGTNQKI